MKTKSKKTKIMRLIPLLAILIILLACQIKATVTHEDYLFEYFPGDYSSRSGLGIKTQVYEGLPLQGKLLQETEYFYDTKAPLLGDPEKLYTTIYDGLELVGGNYPEMYTDKITWGVKVNPRDAENNIEVNYDYIISPRLQGKLTKMGDHIFGYKQYYVGYEYDDYGNVKKEINYGELVPNEPVKKRYFCNYEDDYCLDVYEPYYEVSGLTFPPMSKLTTLHGELNIEEEFYGGQWGDGAAFDLKPEDNTITENRYLYEDPGYGDFLVERNMVSLPFKTTTKSFFNKQLSSTVYAYEVCDECLENCGEEAGFTGFGDWEAEEEAETLMFNVGHALLWENHVGGLVRNVLNHGGVKGKIGNSFDEWGYSWADHTEFTYDECGNVVDTITRGPYTYNAARRMDENYAKNIYDPYNANNIVPTQINIFGNSLENTPLTKSVEYYTFSTTYTRYPIPPIRAIKHEGISKTMPSTKIKKITDENGIESHYKYDVLGRITTLTLEPQDPETDFTKQYFYYTNPGEKWKVKVQEKIQDGLIKETFFIYDGLGRLIQTQLKKSGDRILLSDVKYDALGRKEKESKVREEIWNFGDYLTPDWASLQSQEKVISYEYDALGRITRVVNFDGSDVTKEYRDYQNRIIIYDAKDHWKNYYYDSFNNLIAVQEQQVEGQNPP
jgi:hypothetical protein